MFKSYHNIMLYKERTEFEEFGHAKSDYQRCRNCESIYFRKSWHHQRDLEKAKIKKLHTLKPTLCPACKMIKNRQFEGELIIQNIPKQIQGELIHMIKAYLKRAYDEDCQHRLIAINTADPTNWSITLTENQMANKMAQKIRSVFDKVDVKVTLSKAPEDVMRVKVNFQPLLTLIPA